MEFRGNYLQCILAKQTERVSVFDEMGRAREVEPTEAFGLSLTKLYLGIGHQKRIRYIRPEHVSLLGWPGGNHTTRRLPVRNERGEATTAPIIEHKPLVYSRPQG
jgi:hypothetical protein